MTLHQLMSDPDPYDDDDGPPPLEPVEEQQMEKNEDDKESERRFLEFMREQFVRENRK